MEEIVKSALVLVATESIKEATKNIISIYVKPKLEKLYTDTKKKKDLDLIEYKLSKYLERSYKKHLHMNTLVFKNDSSRTVNDLYIPLTVKKTNMMNREKETKIYIDGYRDDFIPLYKKILLVDNAGMGKSTIIKYLYLNIITKKRGIPVLIELRKINKDINIVDFIINEINGIKEAFEKDSILELIERGDFIFLFDGYDEIKEELKEIVTKNLEDFIDKAPDNEFLISSREESALSCFGDFQRFVINPLIKEEAYSLIKKYDNYGEVSKQLIDLLENQENLEIVKEFLDNPLMVSLLYLAFSYRRDLPNGKHIFYKQVYEALFLDHDKSKGGAYVHPKKSNLNIDDFHKILRILGFITLRQGISYSKEILIENLGIVKKKALEINFNESDFIDDLEHTVPLFLKEGNEYRWCHKSFQEYFAANYIYLDSKENQSIILSTIAKTDKLTKYYNVLDFYYDLDYRGFMESIMYPIVLEFEEFCANSYSNKIFKGYNSDQIYIRKAIQFKYSKIFIKKLSKGNKDEIVKNLTGFLQSVNLDPDNTTLQILPNSVAFISDSKPIKQLMELLYIKGNKLVNSLAKVSFSTLENINFIKEYNSEIYIIDDISENLLNKKDRFNQVNMFLRRTDGNRNDETVILDYRECIKFKENVIKKSKLMNNDISYL
ncbi:NACHT domain-containing NTPase [Clostridium sp.]|uniref:NACHT domain-containing protein n=1 Tax=Clostridium sp. TaxID=1506 RepID=UPI0026289E0C|nr:NACHT domain-containing protein [Clostridium sp.]